MTRNTLWNILYSITGIMLIVPCFVMLASMLNLNNAWLVNVLAITAIVGWVVFPIILCIVVCIGLAVHSIMQKRSN